MVDFPFIAEDNDPWFHIYLPEELRDACILGDGQARRQDSVPDLCLSHWKRASWPALTEKRPSASMGSCLESDYFLPIAYHQN